MSEESSNSSTTQVEVQERSEGQREEHVESKEGDESASTSALAEAVVETEKKPTESSDASSVPESTVATTQVEPTTSTAVESQASATSSEASDPSEPVVIFEHRQEQKSPVIEQAQSSNSSQPTQPSTETTAVVESAVVVEQEPKGLTATVVGDDHHAIPAEVLTPGQSFEAEQEEEEYEINYRIKQEEDEMTLQMLWPGGNDYKIERIDFLVPANDSDASKSKVLIFEFHSAYRLTRELIRISIYNHLGDYLQNTEWICKLLNSPAHPKKHENHLFFYIGDRTNATKTYIQLLRKARRDFNLQLLFDFPPIGQHGSCGMNGQAVRQMNWVYGSDRSKADYDLAVEYVIDFWNLVNEGKNPPAEEPAETEPSPNLGRFSPFSMFSSAPIVRTFAQKLEQYVTRIETLFGLPSQHLPAFMIVQQSNGREDGELEYTANSMQTKWLQTADVCTAILDGVLDSEAKEEHRPEWRSFLAVLLKAVKYHIQLSNWNLTFENLDAQFKRDIENFSPIVSTILSYRPPSERQALQAANGNNSTNTTSVPRDGSWLLAKLAQPFLEVKDIFFTLPGNLRVQPCGSKRLETLEFVLALLDTQHPLIDQLLTRSIGNNTNNSNNNKEEVEGGRRVEQNLLGYSLESIFIWKWNNIVHHRVVKMLKSILARGGEGKVLRRWLFVDFGLLSKIVREMRGGNGSEGNRGHLIVIANTIEKSAAREEAAALLKEGIEEWKEWVATDLERINQKERTMLGGLGPQSNF
eukprot:TRINITY_DN595_c0_g1_i1.p1 TRINITY_DN595_c0_g1~~TRINITY_DN595_c0_g1_i1.p1  ORF type:complete len:753 (-),score=199.43 TRINITY_DN595_c0_g1_i1:209-2467(-)